MRKKRNSRKTVIGAVTAASLIVPTGCDPDYEMENRHESITNDDAYNALPVKMLFSKQDMAYYNYLFVLTDEIIKKPEVAVKFVNNPTKFLKSMGYDEVFEIDKNDSKLQIILALGDAEIREKLENQDLKGFMNLCREKGYATNYSGNIISWLNSYGILSSDSLPETRSQEMDMEEEFIFPIVFAAAAAVYTYYYYINITHTYTKTEHKYGVTELVDRSVEEVYFEVLMLSEQEKDAYIICDQYIEEEVNNIINFVKSENQEITQEQEQVFTNFLKKNLAHINHQIIQK